MSDPAFEWDAAKDAANIAKHGLSFRQAIGIFDGPILTWSDDRTEYGERRQISLGRLGSTLIVTVVHTDRNGRTRIISARPASKRERRGYEGALRQADDRS